MRFESASTSVPHATALSLVVCTSSRRLSNYVRVYNIHSPRDITVHTHEGQALLSFFLQNPIRSYSFYPPVLRRVEDYAISRLRLLSLSRSRAHFPRFPQLAP